jgi:hypothetical protein
LLLFAVGFGVYVGEWIRFVSRRGAEARRGRGERLSV